MAGSVDVTLENLSTAPGEVLRTVYWELDTDSPVDPSFEKEEWFSSTLLEWGRCGKMLVEEEPVAFAQYAPPSLFPRVATFRSGRVSPDAAYLGYCYVVPAERGKGLGADLVRSVARDLVDRGYRALEAVGDLDWDGGWVLPTSFLEGCGFQTIREDERYPLLRLDLASARAPAAAEAVAAAPGF